MFCAIKTTWMVPGACISVPLAIREARLGFDHPDTGRSRWNLADAVTKLENRSSLMRRGSLTIPRSQEMRLIQNLIRNAFLPSCFQ
jgi:hypothetical protein